MPKVVKKFEGWIDIRDLKGIRKCRKRWTFPHRYLTLYDKHWSDGYCRKVRIEVLSEQK